MIKKDSLIALLLLLLIPLTSAAGGILSSMINPEIAAGHPNYARNFHLLTLLKMSLFLGSMAAVAVLWVISCILIIRSKKRSRFWLFLMPFGPFGFAVLSMLNDRAPAKADRYSKFVGKMNWLVRVAYELCTFLVLSEIAYEAMVLHRTLMIRFEAMRTGVSTAQIINIQNASSGMWAFGEGMEVIFLVVLLYVLRPIVFCAVGALVAKRASAEAA